MGGTGSDCAWGTCAAQQSWAGITDGENRENTRAVAPGSQSPQEPPALQPPLSQECSNTCWNLLCNTHLPQTTRELTLNRAQLKSGRDKTPALPFQKAPRLPQCSCTKLCHKLQRVPGASQAISASWDPCEHTLCCPHHAQAQPSEQLGQPKSTVQQGRAAQAPHSLLPPAIPAQLPQKSQ